MLVFISSAAFATVNYVFPVISPLLSPIKSKLANRANFYVKIFFAQFFRLDDSILIIVIVFMNVKNKL